MGTIVHASIPYVGTAFNLTIGKSGASLIQSGSTSMIATDATGTTFIANGSHVVYGIAYEVP